MSLAFPSDGPPLVAAFRRGVIYYNVGAACLVRLLVSLATLRRFYSGPVTILSEGRTSDRIVPRIADALGAAVRSWDCGVPPGPNRIFLAKTNYHLGTPYETTIALDSDTLVKGPLNELFEAAEESTFCVAPLGQRQSSGKIMMDRIRRWKPWLPGDLSAALKFGPAINCGVVAFQKSAPLYQDWLKLALPGRETFVPDEVSCQILLPRYPHSIVDRRWNRSAKHDDPRISDTRIIHYHGKSHCRPGLPHHGALWVAEFERTLAENIADVRAWMPAEDGVLGDWMRRRNRVGKVPGRDIFP
jgi:hypothetical protein